MNDCRENIELLSDEICKWIAYSFKYVNYDRLSTKYEGVIKVDIPDNILSSLKLLRYTINKGVIQAVFNSCIFNIKFYSHAIQEKSFDPHIELCKKEKRISLANNVYTFNLDVYNPYIDDMWKFFDQETIYKMLCKDYKQFIIDRILELCIKY